MSQSRRCDIYKAVDGKWYMTLSNFEYADDAEDCTTYGPFNTQEAAYKELDNHSNPGGVSLDDAGDYDVPKNAVRPTRRFGL